MNIGLAQINPTVGDFDGNCDRVIAAACDAARRGAELTVFSEMCVTGYPARDLLEHSAFLDAQDRAIERLCRELRGLPVILGFAQRRAKSAGNPLYNACALLDQGQMLAVGHKILLPTYDVFDEDRYFEPGAAPTLINFKSHRLGLAICEDYWNDKDFWTTHRKYAEDPIEQLRARGADILISLNASPYSIGKQAIKEKMLSALAKKYACPLLYVNQVGGNDELLFDGRSLAFDARGELVARGPAFEEAVIVVELPETAESSRKSDAALISPHLQEEEEVYRALVMGARDYARKCGFKSAVVGISGGIDSALVATIAAEAFGPQNVTGVAMPSRFNAPDSLADARDLAQRLGINFQIVPIESLAVAFKQALAPIFIGLKEDVTEENIQARIRATLIMAFSNKFGHLLLTTGNKSELATGYCTLYGDMAGGLAVISDLYKTMLYRVAKYLNERNPKNPPIPESSITKAPTAELRYNQKDQDTLPPYDTLDGILKASIENLKSVDEIVALGYDREIVKKTLRMVERSEYKRRQAAPGLKITSKAFGAGRRMPIAQRSHWSLVISSTVTFLVQS